MSNFPYIGSRDWILAQSDDGNTFIPVACLTTNDLDSKTPPIDVSSKCGNVFLAGVKNDQKITASGFTIDQYGQPSKASAAKLYALHTAGTNSYWRVGPAAPVTGDNYYTGQGVVTDWKETAKDGEANTFDITIQVSAPPMTPHNAY